MTRLSSKADGVKRAYDALVEMYTATGAGMCQKTFAIEAGVSSVQTALSIAETMHLLLFEDERGRIYPLILERFDGE